ncbi:MAG TPA: hypothetical protein VFM68_02340 [Candidatus Saccharimonadales bacterium]|nr:hypothetical protein [Candidatus Saccharimonadales bacterium]
MLVLVAVNIAFVISIRAKNLGIAYSIAGVIAAALLGAAAALFYEVLLRIAT